MQNAQPITEYAPEATAPQAAVLAFGEVAAEAQTNADSAAANRAQATQTEFAPLSNEEALRLLQSRNSGVRPNLGRYGYRFVKRAFDIVASGCAIVLLAIPSAVLCAGICIKSPGASPIYSQIRVGRVRKDGGFRTFKMYKFRSMVPDADERLKALRDKNEADGPLFKIKDDPRIIPGVGTFIRRHSIDELGQLLNVLKGDMTLIGPRPGLPREAVQYDERAMQRLTVKPGCGGAWQAGDRSDATFDEMIGMDLMYVKHCSVKYDLQLIFGTLRAMIVGGGAY
jgi:lipopolysaccharide/colanic/teichoic acid biosynthesis glycosyltransferase